MVYGYARCSTNEKEQDISRQVRELRAAGAAKIYLEYEHGDSEQKPQQEAMFAAARPGDTILALEVPRLARSARQVCEIIELVEQKHLKLSILDSISLDARTGEPDPMGEAFLQMAGVFGQLELSMLRARTRSGMANARAKGKCPGRPASTRDMLPESFLQLYPAYKSGQCSRRELAERCRISPITADRYIGLVEKP